jgi:hypothetical protein
MGLNRDGLARFGAVAASHVGEDKVAGLVALVAHGDEVHVEALGTSRSARGRLSGRRCSGSRRRQADHGDRDAGAGRRGPARAGRTGRPAAAGAREPPGAAPDGRPAR